MSSSLPIGEGQLKGFKVASREGVGQSIRFRWNVLTSKSKIVCGRQPENFVEKNHHLGTCKALRRALFDSSDYNRVVNKQPNMTTTEGVRE
jgi:hypothetical protein